jgi:hypothetical protein
MRDTEVKGAVNHAAPPDYTGPERRSFPRIETPLPALVRSVTVDDQWFEAHTVLDNFSSGGVYLRLVQPVAQGQRLFVLIRLSTDLNASASGGYIALHGLALRVEQRPGRAFGTAIKITHHRFI